MAEDEMELIEDRLLRTTWALVREHWRTTAGGMGLSLAESDLVNWRVDAGRWLEEIQRLLAYREKWGPSSVAGIEVMVITQRMAMITEAREHFRRRQELLKTLRKALDT